MPRNPKPPTLANPKRFRTIQDLTQMRPDCGASIDDLFVVDNEFLLIVDMARMNSILNPYNSLSASYVRTHAVIAQNYVRSESCPIYWKAPFLVLLLSHHLKENLMDYEDIGEVVGNISFLSGSFLLLPLREDIPTSLKRLVDRALSSENGVKIKIPNGTYRVFYEQFETPEGSKQEFYQNIVVQKQ